MRLINKFIIILAKLIKISIKSATNVHKLLKLRISSEKAKIKKKMKGQNNYNTVVIAITRSYDTARWCLFVE